MLEAFTKASPTIHEIELSIKNAEETDNKEQLKIGQMLLNNAKINDIIENLNYGLENFELAKIENSIDMIIKYHINIDAELLEKAYEIIDER